MHIKCHIAFRIPELAVTILENNVIDCQLFAGCLVNMLVTVLITVIFSVFIVIFKISLHIGIAVSNTGLFTAGIHQDNGIVIRIVCLFAQRCKGKFLLMRIVISQAVFKFLCRFCQRFTGCIHIVGCFPLIRPHERFGSRTVNSCNRAADVVHQITV